MYEQMTLVTERLVTYFTGIWPLPSMYALMCVQDTLLTEHLVTYFTGVWPLPSM
jgi:hypothetical protein